MPRRCPSASERQSSAGIAIGRRLGERCDRPAWEAAGGAPRVSQAGELIGARVMLVDAISDAALAFYERFDFTPSPIHPMQVFYDLRVVAASRGDATPAGPAP